MCVEFAANIAAEFAFEHGAHWGIRRMLRLVNRRVLDKLRQRVSVRVIEERSFLTREANRYVSFALLMTNPTPWDLTVSDVACSVAYNEIVIMQKAVVYGLPIMVDRETIDGKLIRVYYDPFASIMRLPTSQTGWKLQGKMRIQSYFGTLDLDIPATYFNGGKLASAADWAEAAIFVNTQIGCDR